MNSKRFLIFGNILIVIQGLAFIGNLIINNTIWFSPILIVLTVLDFLYFFKLVKEDNEVVNNKQNSKIKAKNKKSIWNKSYFSLVLICITIICSISIYSFFIYHKEELKQEQENQRLKQEQESKEYYRKQLANCLNSANINRTNLWNANCPDGKSDCKLDSDIVDWIDSRHQQEVNECKMKWNY